MATPKKIVEDTIEEYEELEKQKEELFKDLWVKCEKSYHPVSTSYSFEEKVLFITLNNNYCGYYDREGLYIDLTLWDKFKEMIPETTQDELKEFFKKMLHEHTEFRDLIPP
jgi:hypothetical protein